MKMFWVIIVAVVVFWAGASHPIKAQEPSKSFTRDIVPNGCSVNSDKDFNRNDILGQISDLLHKTVPGYPERIPSIGEGFFVYDLTDPTNFYKSQTHATPAKGCINFINGHVYHFSPVYFPYSRSHIAFFDKGKMKIFESINCNDSNNKLENVIASLNQQLKNDKNQTYVRLKNYRRYGIYKTVDWDKVACSEGKEIPANSDHRYDRWKVLNQLSNELQEGTTTNVKRAYSPFFVEDARAVGFFVWDLTEPSNKQTSLLERVDFKDNHIYHFAYIDLPFSFSNIVILEDGNLKLFKTINCEGRGETLSDVVEYLKNKLKDEKNKDQIITRVRNYRDYGMYASFNGLSTPQCEEVSSK